MEDLFNFFNSITPIAANTQEMLASAFTVFKLKKGAYFITEGQVATRVGFLRSGVVRAFYRDREGTEYNKHFFIPGSMLGGYSSLITGKPNKVAQQALTDCELLVANFRQIEALYDEYPDLGIIARKMAENYFVDKEEKEIEIVLLDADKRYELFQQKFPDLEQLIPQYHIASYLGITPTQLSRIRRKLVSK